MPFTSIAHTKERYIVRRIASTYLALRAVPGILVLVGNAPDCVALFDKEVFSVVKRERERDSFGERERKRAASTETERNVGKGRARECCVNHRASDSVH